VGAAEVGAAAAALGSGDAGVEEAAAHGREEAAPAAGGVEAAGWEVAGVVDAGVGEGDADVGAAADAVADVAADDADGPGRAFPELVEERKRSRAAEESAPHREQVACAA